MLLRIFIALAAVLVSLPGTLAQGLSAKNDPDTIADARTAAGSADIASAWLIAPTTIYPHFVQGSEYEPSGLRLRMADNRILTLMLDANHVFEDRQPRLADLDGDGRDEIILVLTSLEKGASLAAYSVVGDKIALKARTPFIGRPYRWLNPAGIADFNGDGQMDIALVAMPHLAKRLELWTLTDRGFQQIGKMEDISNHQNGSPHTAMSAIADFDGDGVADLAIPDGSRRIIRIISFAGVQGRETNRIALPFAANGAFSLRQEQGNYVLTIPLQGGEIVDISF